MVNHLCWSLALKTPWGFHHHHHFKHEWGRCIYQTWWQTSHLILALIYRCLFKNVLKCVACSWRPTQGLLWGCLLYLLIDIFCRLCGTGPLQELLVFLPPYSQPQPISVSLHIQYKLDLPKMYLLGSLGLKIWAESSRAFVTHLMSLVASTFYRVPETARGGEPILSKVYFIYFICTPPHFSPEETQGCLHNSLFYPHHNNPVR